MDQASQPLTHTVGEAAQLLRIGRVQAYRAVASGEIPSIRVGRRILIPRAALEGLLASAAPFPQGKAA